MRKSKIQPWDPFMLGEMTNLSVVWEDEEAYQKNYPSKRKEAIHKKLKSHSRFKQGLKRSMKNFHVNHR